MKKPLIFKCVFVFLFGITFQVLVGKDIYVSANAGVTQDGTSGNPYKTIQQAADVAVSGDVVQIKAGIYREEVRIKSNGITFQNYNGEKVIVNGTEALLTWTNEGGGVYSSSMAWTVSECSQSDQIFCDGRMMNLTRWPKETNNDLIVNPVEGVATGASISNGDLTFSDTKFTEPAGRWDGAQVWVNLSSGSHDGQGFTGTVKSTAAGKVVISTGSQTITVGDAPWQVQKGTHYYLFNPLLANISSEMSSVLTKGEWFKDNIEKKLYVKTFDGKAPASSLTSANLIEAKKRIFGFRPNTNTSNDHITIKGLNFFATSITTDNQYDVKYPWSGGASTLDANSKNNTIDGCKFLYVTHFTDCSGDYQMQWKQVSGVIISGSDCVIKNCIVQYSAGSGISVIGLRNKVMNNIVYDVNYQNTEAGAINTGKCYAVDIEIAYNTVYNTPQQAINLWLWKNSNATTPGIARCHHNVISDYMIRTHDSGAFDMFGDDKNGARIDHNIIYNATNFLAIGIYLDYSWGQILDHNIIYNVARPIQINASTSFGYGSVKIYNNTLFAPVKSSDYNQQGVLNGVGSLGQGWEVKNNITSGTIGASTGTPAPIISNNLISQSKQSNPLFVNQNVGDFHLVSTASTAIDKGVDVLPYNDPNVIGLPDIGALEYGVTPWTAGVVSKIIVSPLGTTVDSKTTKQYTVTAYGSDNLPLPIQPDYVSWSISSSAGTITRDGLFTASDTTGSYPLTIKFAGCTVVDTIKVNGTLDQLSPSSPMDVVASLITASGFTLNWTASTDNVSVTGYEAYNGAILIGSITGNITTMNITGLTPNTSVNVTLKAIDAAGNKSSASSSIPIITKKAILTISADNKSRKVGEANPIFTLTYSGFVNGDNVSVLKTAPFVICSANASYPVGNYGITVLGGSADNYDITYNNGLLTITPADCGITASITNSIIPNLCNGDTVNLSANILAGATYQWNQDGSIVQSGSSNVFTARKAGKYTVTITKGSCIAYSNPVTIKSKFVGSIPVIVVKSGSIGNCKTVGMVTLGTVDSYASYLWNTLDITPTIDVTESGKYTVTVPDVSGCKLTSAPFEINASQAATPNICIVTVSQTTGKNIVVWKREIANNIKKYKIYKESNKANKYELMDSANYEAMNLAVDLNSDANIRSNRYKVSLIDTCGVESPMSELHKTLHLTLNVRYNGGINLIWENYEGLDFDSYLVLEGNSKTTMAVREIIPSNITSYSIADATKNYYQIAINTPESCTTTSILKSESGPYGQSLSNIAEFKTDINSITTSQLQVINIYPNPANDLVTIITEGKGTLILTDISGRIIKQATIVANETKLDVSELQAGCYIISIQSESGVATGKLLVE